MSITSNQDGLSDVKQLSTSQFVEDSVSYWISAIICPLLLFTGVIGNLYAVIGLLAIRSIQKNPAILTIITIGMYYSLFIVLIPDSFLVKNIFMDHRCNT